MPIDSHWLSLNAEPAIEPELPIVDAHHHFWDRPGFRYLFEDFQSDVRSGHNIIGSVFVEASSRQNPGMRSLYRSDGLEELRSLGETEYADGVATMCSGPDGAAGVCAGIVAYVDLRLAERVAPILAMHSAMPRVKGIRNMTAWHADPAICNPDLRTTAGMLAEYSFRRGFAELAASNLTFDAWLFAPQIPDLVDLAHTFPGVKIVLDHFGGIMGTGTYTGRRDESMAKWRQDLHELAQCPNAYVKLGGMASLEADLGFMSEQSPHLLMSSRSYGSPMSTSAWKNSARTDACLKATFRWKNSGSHTLLYGMRSRK